MNKSDQSAIGAILSGCESFDFHNYVIRISGDDIRITSKVNMFETSFTSRMMAAVWLARVIKASE